MANYYLTLGYTGIRADLKGYDEPGLIWWTGREQESYKPDLTCLRNDAQSTTIILEAETCESLFTEHTHQQWRLFAARAKHIGGEFHVVVPRLCQRNNQNVTGIALVSEIAAQWGLKVDHVWWPSE